MSTGFHKKFFLVTIYYIIMLYGIPIEGRCVKGALAMSKHKHLTLENRSYIQHSLDIGHSIRQIALHLGKHPTTISKEIRLHRKPLVNAPVGRIRNRCIHRFTCSLSGVCDYKECRWEYCRYCSQCYKHCEDYIEELCPRLLNSPYVCNGCEKMHKRQCSLGKFHYQALAAHKKYKETLSSCREGISFTEADLQWLDLNQRDVDMLASHINSLVRKKLNNQSPTTTFSFFHGEQTLRKLGISPIQPSEVLLSPAMFKG